MFWNLNAFADWISPVPLEMLQYVLKNAEEGNAASIISKIDKFGWEKVPMMNVGDIKGELIDDAIINHSINNINYAVEFGG